MHRVVVTYWYRRRQARRHRNSRSEAAGTDRVERRGRSRRGIATTARRRQRPSTATHTTSLCTPPARCTHAQATCCIAAATYRIQLETLQRWYGKCPPKCPFLGGGFKLTFNTWFLVHTRVHTPTDISIGSAVLTQRFDTAHGHDQQKGTHTHTHGPCYIRNNRPLYDAEVQFALIIFRTEPKEEKRK